MLDPKGKGRRPVAAKCTPPLLLLLHAGGEELSGQNHCTADATQALQLACKLPCFQWARHGHRLLPQGQLDVQPGQARQRAARTLTARVPLGSTASWPATSATSAALL
jgi:hypothetical protein